MRKRLCSSIDDFLLDCVALLINDFPLNEYPASNNNSNKHFLFTINLIHFIIFPPKGRELEKIKIYNIEI